MVELSKQWVEKAEAKLVTASTGVFFKRTKARLIPTFHRGDAAANIVDGKS